MTETLVLVLELAVDDPAEIEDALTAALARVRAAVADINVAGVTLGAQVHAAIRDDAAAVLAIFRP